MLVSLYDERLKSSPCFSCSRQTRAPGRLKYTCIYVFTHICTYICKYACYTHMHMYVHIYIYIYIHTYYIYIYIYLSLCIHIYIYIHTATNACLNLKPLPLANRVWVARTAVFVLKTPEMSIVGGP